MSYSTEWGRDGDVVDAYHEFKDAKKLTIPAQYNTYFRLWYGTAAGAADADADAEPSDGGAAATTAAAAAAAGRTISWSLIDTGGKSRGLTAIDIAVLASSSGEASHPQAGLCGIGI